MEDKRYFVNSRPAPASSFLDEAEKVEQAPVAMDTGGGGGVAHGAGVSGADAEAVATAIKAALSVAGGRCIRLFVAGAVTHIGKTTVCLSILAALRKAGVQASHLGYVKPATQCEAPDLLKAWCEAEGVEYVSGEGAPLVFYQGFTRSFLAGDQGTSAQWLERIAAKLDELAQGRRVLVVDGVGYPAVGSIVGVDNADVAKAARAPVLLVCPSGSGAAIDSFSLNRMYFVSKGVPVLGAVFNMGDLEGFNSWDKCADAIGRWFALDPARRERTYGVVPLAPDLKGLREKISETPREQISRLASLNASHFAAYANLPALLTDAALDPWNRAGAGISGSLTSLSAPPDPKRLRTTPGAATPAAGAGGGAPKSRQEVAAAAKKQGARGGG